MHISKSADAIKTNREEKKRRRRRRRRTLIQSYLYRKLQVHALLLAFARPLRAKEGGNLMFCAIKIRQRAGPC
jgi:hypothetical protein